MLNRIRSVFRRSVEPDPPRVRSEPTVRREATRPFDWKRAGEAAKPAVKTENPFRPYVAPKGVRGDSVTQLAMDSNIAGSAAMQAWLSGGIADGAYFLGYPRLSEMAQRAEYRNMVETLATESVREWIEFKGRGAANKKDRIDALEAEFERLQVRDVMRQMVEADGYYGIGLLFVDTGLAIRSSDLATPLLPRSATVKKGSVKALRPVDPNWATPNQYGTTTPLAADFYKPSTWWVQGSNIHATRLLRFVSRDVPDIIKPCYNFGGVALTQLAKPYVDNWLRTRQSVSDLINAFSVVALSTDMSAYAQDPKGLLSRIEAFNRFRSNRGTFVLNKDSETLQILNATLAGLDKLQAQAQEQQCSVAQIPLVKYTGITPCGLNASSDGEIRVFYDRISAHQETFLRPNLTTIMHLGMLNLWGEIDEDIEFHFRPLWQLSEVEQATVDKTVADTRAVYEDIGAVSNNEVRETLATDDRPLFPGVNLSGPAPNPPDPPPTLSPFGGDPSAGEE